MPAVFGTDEMECIAHRMKTCQYARYRRALVLPISLKNGSKHALIGTERRLFITTLYGLIVSEKSTHIGRQNVDEQVGLW